MTMPQAIRSAFARWRTFSGRAGGTEYWWFVLFGPIVFGLASLLDHAVFGRDALFGAICALVFLMPYLAVAVRRLHDTNRSGWWLLLVFVPLVGNIVQCALSSISVTECTSGVFPRGMASLSNFSACASRYCLKFPRAMAKNPLSEVKPSITAVVS